LFFPIWESATINCISERETRDCEPLPIGGGISWDNKTGSVLKTPPAQYVMRDLMQGMFVAQYDAATSGISNGFISHTIWVDVVADLYGPSFNTVQPTPTADPTLSSTAALRDELAELKRELKLPSKGETKEVFATPRNSPRSRAAAMKLDGEEMVLVSKAELAASKDAPPPGKLGTVRVDAGAGWFGRS